MGRVIRLILAVIVGVVIGSVDANLLKQRDLIFGGKDAIRE